VVRPPILAILRYPFELIGRYPENWDGKWGIARTAGLTPVLVLFRIEGVATVFGSEELKKSTNPMALPLS
jgi:hypothetical protein